jgi:hypothetical protein
MRSNGEIIVFRASEEEDRKLSGKSAITANDTEQLM